MLSHLDLKPSVVDMNWIPNPNWNSLETLSKGDIAQFRLINGFSYLVKVIVTSADAMQITGSVEAVYDWDTKELVTGGPIKELVGTQQTLNKTLLQNIIKSIPPTDGAGNCQKVSLDDKNTQA
jgi:hypothetical protein